MFDQTDEWHLNLFHYRFINTVTVKYMELQCSKLFSNSVYDVKMFKQYKW